MSGSKKTKNDDEYPMKNGKAMTVIIQNFDFDKRLNIKPKNGNRQEHAKLIQEMVSVVKGSEEPKVLENKKYEEIVTEMKEIAESQANRTVDCIIVVVLTTGTDRGDLYAKDRFYPVEKLQNIFNGNKCQGLAGKPKLFFISVRDSRSN